MHQPSWSQHKLETILTCGRQFYYTYIERPEISIPSEIAKGQFLHKKLEQFFKDGSPKYKSKESWSNAAGAQWTQIIKKGSISGRRIAWKDEKEPWILKSNIKNLCLSLYDRLVAEGPPLLQPEHEFTFELSERRFTGRIDEIRAGKLIRDYKTGKARISQFEADHSYQLTFYALAFCTLCYADDKFREKAGVSKRTASQWGGNPIFISDDVMLELDMIDTGQRIRTTRDNTDYSELCSIIDEAEEKKGRMKEKDLYLPERGSHCKFCLYQKQCEKDTAENVIETRPRQIFLFTQYKEKPQSPKPRVQNLKLPF
ncbi:PD-(D/E)XK nuclease family protein [Candidatus Woesearchaeota archaeon]|nr:PD-(D/E)XK nuclease family protein [Candidatus Woesearchaeota archaeon]